MSKKQYRLKQKHVFPDCRVGVMQESFTDERESEKKTLDYNDWNIYHGA